METPDILSEDEFREFWIAFDHNEVRVGRGGEWEPFMNAALPGPCNVTHYGFTTGWGASGWWKFYSEYQPTGLHFHVIIFHYTLKNVCFSQFSFAL